MLNHTTLFGYDTVLVFAVKTWPFQHFAHLRTLLVWRDLKNGFFESHFQHNVKCKVTAQSCSKGHIVSERLLYDCICVQTSILKPALFLLSSGIILEAERWKYTPPTNTYQQIQKSRLNIYRKHIQIYPKIFKIPKDIPKYTKYQAAAEPPRPARPRGAGPGPAHGASVPSWAGRGRGGPPAA